MPHNEVGRPMAGNHRAAQATTGEEVQASVTQWADIYDAASDWVRWNGRRRWPALSVNDQVWACSITSWAMPREVVRR